MISCIFNAINQAKKSFLLLIIFLWSSCLLAQTKSTNLQQSLHGAIKKAYPSSVRMWGFDVAKNERTSAQFSGVVVSKDGLILTAAHTVTPGQTYKVFFTDGRTFIAKALGRIDLIKSPGIPDAGMLQLMEKGPFPFAEMGNSSSLHPSTPCVSISYPEKLNQELPTIRFGQIVDTKNQYGFLQSSCKMEPGDSGGPLFDIDGKVIGIHSAIDVSENMNFEIPIDVYRKYWTALHEEKNHSEYPMADSVVINPIIPQKTFSSKPLPKIARLTNNTRLVQVELDGKKMEAAVTLINYKDAQGKKTQWMIGKSSLLNGPITIIGAETAKVEVIARDLQNDLVLLKAMVQMKGGFEIEFGNTKTVDLGNFVTSLLPDGKYESSVIGGTAITLPKSSSVPYLGIAVLFKSKPATVSVVKPGTPAALLGIKTGDTILSINGIALQHASDFTPTISKFWGGEKVDIAWKSG
jgi:serine protease Do